MGSHLELAARHGFFTCYESAQHLPRWTAHQILPASSTPQPRPRFRPDSQLPHPTLTNRDFARSGFHRGHLTPAAVLAASPAAYRDSFLLSIVMPQSPQVNNGIWRRLDNADRRLALHADSVLVLSGDTKLTFAALVPNHSGAASLTLSDIATTARALEQAIGLDLFPDLAGPEEQLLESTRSVLPAPRQPLHAKPVAPRPDQATSCVHNGSRQQPPWPPPSWPRRF